MSKIKEILDGHINELKSKIGLSDLKFDDVFKAREAICNSCPLKNGNTCNPRLFINPETMDVVSTPQEGFVKGCGCRLSAKQKSPSSSCPANFWGGEFNNKK
ncbi:MAG: hypothetical protein KDH96_02475 [Candidatus Riesia sp.]|nr:hypothetical protein [Candidatus Riesia sp.]